MKRKNRKNILEKKILNNDYISHRNIEYFEYEIKSCKDISYMQIIGKNSHIIYSYVSPKILFSKPCQTHEDRSRGC